MTSNFPFYTSGSLSNPSHLIGTTFIIDDLQPHTTTTQCQVPQHFLPLALHTLQSVHAVCS